MSKDPISIRQLAQYGLDYVSLVSSNRSRSRPVKTEHINSELLDVANLVFEEDADSLSINLVTALDEKYDQTLSEDEKSEEQKEAERKINYARKLLDKFQEIDAKIRTDGYTKRMVLQTGFVSFEAKRYLDSEYSDDYEKYEAPLLQIPVTSLEFKFTAGGTNVSFGMAESCIEILDSALKGYLPQQYYDSIFKFIADSEAEDKTTLPIATNFIDELWATVRVQLERVEARAISESPSYDTSVVAIAGKTNHFLAEDLKEIASLEDDELLETSLGSWVSDEDMAIEQDVPDDGSTEIFFPFDYDKYQLKVLGITGNKAVIVEGPPGTGKSQTISNLLVHLAATGKRVLFASQKDQAIRGVKDKLKTLDVPFLFGYIPDKTSKLYTEDDEKDSAANTLVALNREFQKGKVGDLRKPLSLLKQYSRAFTQNIEANRSVYALYEERRSLDYLDAFYPYGLDVEWYSQCLAFEETVDGLESSVQEYGTTHEKLIAAAKKKFEDLQVDHQVTIESIVKIYDYFKENMPERSGWIGGKVNEVKLRNALKDRGRNLLQEIYVEIEKILFSDNTKSARLKLLDGLSGYFVYDSERHTISESRAALNKLLASKELSASVYTSFKNIIASHGGKDKVFGDMARYYELSDQIRQASLYSSNDLNREIKDIRKFYRTNTTNYVRNRILTRVNEANNNKGIRATLAQVARSLTKSKKANKTFDRLKHNGDNFSAMSKVLPIWMMSLDDVSRIVPLEMNAFDYVIIDEASQCNFAYAFPAMFRAKHTIFFGDTLQMRDDNIMFKSNDQLNAIAKKYKVPDVYQIKAEEDTVKSVMDIASLNGFKTATLRYHYRSPQELIGFSNESFYEPIGRRLEAVNDNIVPYKDTGRVLLTHVVEADATEEMSDRTNMAEVQKVKELIGEIKNDSILHDKSIAVLTFFNEQAELLRKEIEDEDIKVSIIDGIQGDERDIVIYSFVIKDPTDKRRYVALTGEGGEIRKDIAAGRVNVAFSRAKLQVHAVTSLAPELWPEGIWIKRYLEYIETRGAVVRRHVKEDQQFDSNFEEDVYNYLAHELHANEYTLDTQVESLGFKIDLVVYQGGKKLALEMDGPSHFEDGDGQVYVKDDWDRQCALETAGWNFYRISYFDWMRDQEVEKKALIEYIAHYFNDGRGSTKSRILKSLEEGMTAPEEASREAYVTEFSDEHVDNIASVDVSQPKVVNSVSAVAKEFSVGDRGVDQGIFGSYLATNIGGVINVRYQTPRAGSARHWRSIKLVKYDDIYFYADAADGRDYLVKFRRDRVVEFR